MYTFKPEAKVKLALLEGGDFQIKFDSKCMDDLIIKRSQVPPEVMGAEARKLLAASLASCMCSTLLALLKLNNIEVKDFQAEADANATKDEDESIRVVNINLKINLRIPKKEESLKNFKKVERLFKKGCLMSRSLEKGIKINYSINT